MTAIATTVPALGWLEWTRLAVELAELDRLDPQILRQLRLVLPNLTDHRLSRLTTESLVELLVLWRSSVISNHGALEPT